MSVTGEAGNQRVFGRIVLAHEAPVRIGALNVDPPRRRVTHDDGREQFLEPRVMQVLVALIRAGGDILTRDDLLASCWSGLVVGEDALSRVIGRVRRLSEGLGAGIFEIETITKVGYRAVVATADRSRIGAISASGERPPLALPVKPSIAVLPFKNLSGDADQEYLADAISEDIVTALSRWRWFFVIASHSSFAYKNTDIDLARVGQELGVRYLITGAVRTSGERVRVSVQLIDALSGLNLWADEFDHKLVDVFALQDEVTEQIASAIEPAMLQGEATRIERKSLADFSALDCYYKGMWRHNLMTMEDDKEALSLFCEAVRLGPELALAHVGVARLLYARALFGDSIEAASDLRESLAAARTAAGLDPREATAYYAAAAPELYLGNHEAALDNAQRALTLNPNFARAHYRKGQVLIFAGRPEPAVAPLERSISLSPCDPQLRLMLETLALAHYQMHDYEVAAELAGSASRQPGGVVSTILVASLAQLGRFEEAVQALRAVDPLIPSRSRPLAAPYANPVYREHLREGLRSARAVERSGV